MASSAMNMKNVTAVDKLLLEEIPSLFTRLAQKAAGIAITLYLDWRLALLFAFTTAVSLFAFRAMLSRWLVVKPTDVILNARENKLRMRADEAQSKLQLVKIFAAEEILVQETQSLCEGAENARADAILPDAVEITSDRDVAVSPHRRRNCDQYLRSRARARTAEIASSAVQAERQLVLDASLTLFPASPHPPSPSLPRFITAAVLQ